MDWFEHEDGMGIIENESQAPSLGNYGNGIVIFWKRIDLREKYWKKGLKVEIKSLILDILYLICNISKYNCLANKTFRWVLSPKESVGLHI